MALKVIKIKNSRNYYLRGSVRGVSVYETTGTDRKKTADEIRIQRENQLLAESVYGKRNTVTFAQGAASYLEEGGSPRFLGNLDKNTAKWSGLIGRFGDTLMSDIDQKALDEASRELFPDASPDTRNRQAYTPFIAVWNHCVVNGWCERREWRRPRRPKGTRLRSVNRRTGSFPVPYERAAEFVRAMWPLDAINMTILFYTGMRPIELMTLEDNQVRHDDRWIVLPASKTGEPRGVPIADMIAPILRALTDTFQGVIINRFNHAQGRIEPYPEFEDAGGQMAAAIRAARRTTGITDISPYTARHSVSTYLVAAGVHTHIKAQILGHAVTEMSRVYTELPQASLIQAIDKLPKPQLWQDAEIVKNPWSMLEKIVNKTKNQSVNARGYRPW